MVLHYGFFLVATPGDVNTLVVAGRIKFFFAGRIAGKIGITL